MIPVARKLQEMSHNVIIASGNEHLKLFREEIPGLFYINFPGFKPGYSGYLPQYLPLLLKTPLLLFHTIREHYRLKSIIRKHSIDIVISDNRFGLWNRKVRCVYITHMPLIPFPKPFQFLEFVGIYLHRAVIRRYDLCFIPDLPGEVNFTGRLSHGIKLPGSVRYIGILSRFSMASPSTLSDPFPFKHNTLILSGPEPQREIFKQKILTLLEHEKPITVILEGKPGEGNEIVRDGNFAFCKHLPAAAMRDVISGSEAIITRAGYSTIMELISLKCSAILVPTPGQTEQEYLAEYLSAIGWFTAYSQGNLGKGISITMNNAACPAEINEQSAVLLNEALRELLN